MELALKLIQEAKEKRLTSLDLGNCGLTELPDELFELTWLEELILCNSRKIFDEQKRKYILIGSKNRDKKNYFTFISPKISELLDLKTLIIGSDSVDLFGLNDITPLQSLTKLQMLDLSSTHVEDISALKDMTQLHFLDLNSTQVQDISALKELTHLQYLYLSSTQVQDISALKDLANLQELSLNSTQVQDISALKELTQLQSLSLSLMQVQDISALKKLTHLQMLYLSSTQVQDISALKDLTQLQSLDLSSTQVQDISVLKDLTQLQSLYLSSTQIQDISALKELTQLHLLNLGSTQVQDISVLKELTQLQTLFLSSTQVQDVSVLKELTQLHLLFLSSTQVQDISVLKDLTQLHLLFLSSTQVQDVSALKELTQLYLLDLSSTQVQDISALKDMQRLQSLYLSSTKVQDFSALKDMQQLQWLDLNSTQVQDISALKNLFKKENFRISVNNCPLPKPLLAAIKKGNKAVLNYFNKPKQYLYEARVLILGEPRAGKTTLRRKLKSISAPMPLPTESTKAFDIEIDPYNCGIEIDGKKQKMKYHLWDFGGQDYYRLLHQLFVAEQSIYVIVTDTDRSKNEEEIDFWLDTIQRLGKDKQGNYSPVILFQNPKTNREGGEFSDLKKRYKFWQQSETFVINLDKIASCNVDTFDKKELERFNRFKNYLEESFCALKHVGQEMPTEWINIRKVLDKKQKENWITVEAFNKICTSKGMEDPEEQDDLLDIFRTLGFLLHYKDSALKGMVILNTEWVTDALYRVLDDSIVKRNKGWFAKADAEKIWFEPRYKNRTEELLALMKEFKLSYYNAGSQKYIVPAKLPEDTEGLPEWNTEYNVRMYLQYDWLPRAVATQLIVSLHNDIVQFDNGEQWIWRKGAVLDGRRLDLKNTQVRIEDNWRDNRIELSARGASSEFLIREVIKNWREVHQPFEDKTLITTIILCACEKCKTTPRPFDFDYEDVLAARKDNDTLQCNKSRIKFKAEAILRGVFDAIKVSIDANLEKNGKLDTEIKKLISFGNLEEAINLLPDKTALAQIKFRLSRLKDEKISGTLTGEQYRSSESDIAKDLLYYSENFFQSGMLERFNAIKERSFLTNEFVLKFQKFNESEMPAAKIFISYSKKDTDLKDELNTHLASIKRRNRATTWDDRHIIGGELWDETIKTKLMEADIILFLVSSDFIATDYIWDNEIPLAEEQRKKGKAQVIPIILRPCQWTKLDFAKQQALPSKGVPINTFTNKDAAWLEVANGIEAVITSIQNKN